MTHTVPGWRRRKKTWLSSVFLLHPVSVSPGLADAILEICKEEVGDALHKPTSNFWYFDTVVKNYASTSVKRGVGGV
jgi:hypothetical protein